MRKKLVIANWKMNLISGQAHTLASAIARGVAGREGPDVVITPSFTSLGAVASALEGSGVELGAQNVSWADSGELTGEVAPAMLVDAGCRWVLVGHSERRSVFSESQTMIRNKVAACMRAGLIPVLCVGETAEEKGSGKTERIVESQLTNSLIDIDLANPGGLVVAYEPVWAIGTGEVPLAGDVELVHGIVRDTLAGTFGLIAGEMRIIYGGSVSVDNIAMLLTAPDVDGVLVGGSSLQAESFVRIVRVAGEI